MTEYKFRAWEDGEMNYQVRCGGMFDGIPTAPTVWIENRKEWVHLIGQPHTEVMQYIGIKDDYGIEIYEGDIVEVTYSEYGFDGETIQDYQITGYIRREFMGFNICIGIHEDIPVFSDYVAKVMMGIFLMNEKWKVIGNIYENPEFLKKITK